MHSNSIPSVSLNVFTEKQSQLGAVDRTCFQMFSQENICANFIKKETLAQVFSCEFCETFQETYFYRTSLVAASVLISVTFSSVFR